MTTGPRFLFIVLLSLAIVTLNKTTLALSGAAAPACRMKVFPVPARLQSQSFELFDQKEAEGQKRGERRKSGETLKWTLGTTVTWRFEWFIQKTAGEHEERKL